MKGTRVVVFAAAAMTAFFMLSISFASAQGFVALGEARFSGTASIRGSDGQWTAAPSSYPVLQDTAIRTGEGTASVYFKDGSMVSLSNHTEAVISGDAGSYKISLSSGTLTFNVVPPATLSIAALTTEVSGGKGMTSGAVTLCGNQWVQVGSNAGEVSVMNGSESRIVDAGQSIFVGADNNFYATGKCEIGAAAVAAGGAGSAGAAGSAGGTSVAEAGVLLGFTGGTVFAVREGFRGHEGFASPSSPGAQGMK
jgi:hypothetical protein